MAAPIDGEGVFLKESFETLLKKCENQMQNSTDDSKHLLDCCSSRCNRTIEKLKNLGSNPIEEETLIQVLQDYSQAVLDYTYVDECLLVEESFPEEDCKNRVQAIFSYLEKVEHVVKHCFPDKMLISVVGVDIMECLNWRRGALLYMYCCTVHKNLTRVKNNILDFKQNLLKGVHHLKNVLSIREPSGASSACGNDHDTLGLLNIGAYSDTHLLTMMYAGDMCYWYLTVNNEIHPTPGGDGEGERPTARRRTGAMGEDDIAMKETGKEMLNAYLKAVHGPLAGLGWNSQRAEELLKFFTSS